MGITLMMSAKLATPGLLKIRVFWNEGYYVMISVYDVTNKTLPCDSNYIVDMIMWLKLSNSSISFLNFIRIWPEKPPYLREGVGLSSII